jgi:hypothetical protein
MQFTINQQTYLDSADTFPPGAPFHRRNNMPMYSMDINASGTMYDDRKKETCKRGEKIR